VILRMPKLNYLVLDFDDVLAVDCHARERIASVAKAGLLCFVAMDARLLYAAPSHCLCIIIY
jgi:hypothetical protein